MFISMAEMIKTLKISRKCNFIENRLWQFGIEGFFFFLVKSRDQKEFNRFHSCIDIDGKQRSFIQTGIGMFNHYNSNIDSSKMFIDFILYFYYKTHHRHQFTRLQKRTTTIIYGRLQPFALVNVEMFIRRPITMGQ